MVLGQYVAIKGNILEGFNDIIYIFQLYLDTLSLDTFLKMKQISIDSTEFAILESKCKYIAGDSINRICSAHVFQIDSISNFQ